MEKINRLYTEIEDSIKEVSMLTDTDGEIKTGAKKFYKGYTFKVFLLAFLILMLLIPLAMIGGLISERNRTAISAEREIMTAWGSEFVAAGPVVIIPGVRTTEHTTQSQTTNATERRVEIRRQPFSLVLTPDSLNIAADFKTEIRKRGIFSVPLFSGDVNFSGSFDPTAAIASLAPNETLSLDQAEIVVALSSQKGIRKIDRATWNGGELFFRPGNRNFNAVRGVESLGSRNRQMQHNPASTSSGINASAPFATAQGENDSSLIIAASKFDIAIAIQGGQFVRFLPLGQATRAEVTADWSSPSFQGSFLPVSSNITENGFDALWEISYLSRDIPLFWRGSDGEGTRSTADYSEAAFGVNFFRAIDTYSLNTRATKYGILFLIIPFLTLFLLEVITKKRVHPVPYLLCGIANIIFYLLLLSLSEQMQFFPAYLIASISVIALLTLYSRSLLPSWNKSWYMGLTATLSYVLLYAVLNAESYALLIGSIGSFVVVALVMFLTSKLNWYGDDQ